MKTRTVLKLEDAQPGMRIADAVLDDKGRVLVPAGVELSESMLQGLRRREIPALWVEMAVEEDPAAREAYQAEVMTQLDKLFRQAGEGVETRQLYQAVLDFRMAFRA